MSRKLRFGSSLIRFLLLAGLVGAMAGIYEAWTIPDLPEDADLQVHSYILIACFVINGVTALGVFWMLAARKMLKRINVLATAMNQGAEGDLSCTVPAESEDEIGLLNRTFNAMLQRLAGTVRRVGSSIDELKKISADVKEVSTCAVAASSLQSEGVRETSHAVQEISHSVAEVAASVDSLSRSATDNSSSILEMSASIEEVSMHMEELSRAVEDVSSSIFEMAAAEKEIGSSINNLMEDSLAAASSVAEMDLSIKQVEQNALETATISETVRRDAESGKESVEATISGIGEIRRSSRITFETIQKLSARAGDIGSILSVIDDLAEQTNLLALNASIIAAQAGEHGKGFAVVAGEIKGLAKRTSNSTKEIADIITAVQEETQKAVKAITVAEEKIGEGEELSQRSGEALNKIVEGVQMATDRVSEIARTTVEQAKGSQTMRTAMERVSEMVQQIAKAAKEQGHGTELITAAAERMKNLTAQVRVSTREQSKTSNHIVKATEDINAMIDQIRQACSVQTGSSRSIVQAVENIEQSTRTTMESAQVMDGAVSGLTQQIELLQEEMSSFRCAER